jgi:bifunctional ADP-heptose synthase (sugar kinase/adenylyltransferase)
MDTRDKIIPLDQVPELVAGLRARNSAVRIITGYFDVLVPEHIRRLREIADGDGVILVVIVDPPEPVLPGRARAELVAALAMVDYVIPAGEQAAQALLRHFHPAEIVREESADLLRARRLKEHVRRRNQQ